jgi:hypothetical protein
LTINLSPTSVRFGFGFGLATVPGAKNVTEEVDSLFSIVCNEIIASAVRKSRLQVFHLSGKLIVTPLSLANTILGEKN